MEQLVMDLQRYLKEVTGLKVTAHPADLGNLPYYLSHRYAFYRLSVAGATLLAVCLRREQEFKPVQFKKDIRQIPLSNIDSVCVIAGTLAGYVRKRMIEQGIAFVVPGVQMYLPQLGMELRARGSGKRSGPVNFFSPATQVLIIHWLLGDMRSPTTPLSLAKRLHYSTMTMSRALSELAVAGIGQVERKGRERLLFINKERRVVWQNALPLMRSPVLNLKRVKIPDLQTVDILPAGLSALAQRTMLSEPEIPEYAVSSDAWKTLASNGIETIPVEEPGTCVLQVWRYDPFLLKTEGIIDPFSLYLSLQQVRDERVESALEEIMEQVKW
jgi:hypothetical protein